MSKQNQMPLPAIPMSEITRLAQEFIAYHNDVRDSKDKMKVLSEQIMVEMSKLEREVFTVTEQGVQYKFALTRGNTKLVLKEIV